MRGLKQVADIMNRFKGDRMQMFELLRGHDESLVDKIEDQMYDFFILARQSQEVLQTLLEAVPLEEWVVALKGAEPELVKAVLGAMPRRQAQQMETIKRRQGRCRSAGSSRCARTSCPSSAKWRPTANCRSSCSVNRRSSDR